MKYVECVNVHYISIKRQTFSCKYICENAIFYSDYSFFLTRVSCVRPSASFDKYTEVERLEGDSRYRAGPHGLQINNRYKSPMRLDLDREHGKYLSCEFLTRPENTI
ncbi:putative ubiquitinyl hydrolase 1 [Helianthus anomalus]